MAVRTRGPFAQYEKARVVANLRAARERFRAAKGKCEGRKYKHALCTLDNVFKNHSSLILDDPATQ